jgi:hypothetical protein
LGDFEGTGPITRRNRIGGLLNYRHRAAA